MYDSFFDVWYDTAGPSTGPATLVAAQNDPIHATVVVFSVRGITDDGRE